MNLLDSPFSILRIPSDANAQEIQKAVEETVFAGVASEENAREAQRTLMASRPRLFAELSWFPGCSTFQIDQVLTALRRGISADSILDLLKSVRGIARANLAAHLCNQGVVDGNVIRALVTSQKVMVPEYALPLINEAREKTGFPKVSEELIREALGQLRSEHCEAAYNAIVTRPHPGKAMTSVVEAFKEADGPVADLLDMVAARYDAWSAPTLSRISDDLDELIRMLREDPASTFEVGEIQEKLRLWDEYSQPLQLLQEAKGLDEKKSLDVYEKLRELCIWLANEKEEYEKALEISKALHETFPELPSVLASVERDMETLEGLISHARVDEALQGLVAVVEEIVKSPSDFSVSMDRGDFREGREKSLAGRLYAELLSAVEATTGTSESEVPWQIVRSLAIRLNNNFGCSGTALQLLKALTEIRTIPPLIPRIRELLRADIAQAQRNAFSRRLTAALERKELGVALSLIEQLLDLTTDAKERTELTYLKTRVQSTLREKNAKQRGCLVALVAVTAVFIFMAIVGSFSESGNSSNTYSGSSSRSSTSRLNTSRSNTQRSTNSVPRSTYQQPNQTQSVNRSQRQLVLERQIAAGKKKLSNLESDLESIYSELEDLETRLKSDALQIESYERRARRGALGNTSGYEDAIESYNLLVSKYNELLEEAEAQYERYEKELAEINRLIDEYNTLIGRGSSSPFRSSETSGTSASPKRSSAAKRPSEKKANASTTSDKAAPEQPKPSIPFNTGERITYRVQPGDTLSKIADRYGVTAERLLAFNTSIESPNQIFVGQEIVVPASDEKAPEDALAAAQEKMRPPSSGTDDEPRVRNLNGVVVKQIAVRTEQPKTLAIVSHKDDVMRIQGEPDGISKYGAIGRETWFYGKSTVVFNSNEGSVTEVNNTDGNLRVTARTEGNNAVTSPLVSSSNARSGPHFTEGSSKDDVLRLQGTPDDIIKYDALGKETWSYGGSSVEFDRGGRVTQWNNYGKNLKVALIPGSNTTSASYFTAGSHKDDVLRLQGTPDDIIKYDALGKETWSYGGSSVEFDRGGRVTQWNNYGNNLRVR
jgi:LysM repeat protein